MITAERRREARRILEQVEDRFVDPHNWGKGGRRLVDVRGQHAHCLVGAIDVVARQRSADAATVRTARRAVRRAAGTVWLPHFNDRAATSIQDVRRAVKAAVASLGGETVESLEREVEPAERTEDVATPAR